MATQDELKNKFSKVISVMETKGKRADTSVWVHVLSINGDYLAGIKAVNSLVGAGKDVSDVESFARLVTSKSFGEPANDSDKKGHAWMVATVKDYQTACTTRKINAIPAKDLVFCVAVNSAESKNTKVVNGKNEPKRERSFTLACATIADVDLVMSAPSDGRYRTANLLETAPDTTHDTGFAWSDILKPAEVSGDLTK